MYFKKIILVSLFFIFLLSVCNVNASITSDDVKNIKRSEFFKMIDSKFMFEHKTQKRFIDVPLENPFFDLTAKLAEAEIISGYPDRTIRLNNYLTFEEAAVIVSKAFSIEWQKDDKYALTSGTQKFWSEPYISLLISNDIAYPSINKQLNTKPLTHQEAVEMINKAVGTVFSKPGFYDSKKKYENLLINTSGVTLKNGVIDGTVIISEGVKDGTVSFINTSVNNRIIVRGGGNSGLTITGGKGINKIILNKVHKKVYRLISDKDAYIDELSMEKNIGNVYINAYIKNVYITGESPVWFEVGKIENLFVENDNAWVHILENASVENIIVTGKNAKVINSENKSKATSIDYSTNGEKNNSNPYYSIDDRNTSVLTGDGNNDEESNEEIPSLDISIKISNLSRKSGEIYTGDTLICKSSIRSNYQWLRDGSIIPDATTSEYKTEIYDEGCTISVKATAKHNNSITTISNPTSKVIPLADVIITNDNRTGNEVYILDELKANVFIRLRTDTEPIISYKWKRNGEYIENALNETYKIAKEDLGKTISIEVSFNGEFDYIKESIQTAFIQDIHFDAVILNLTRQSGDIYKNDSLSVSGSFYTDPADIPVISYQWKLNGIDITGANELHYNVSNIDECGVLQAEIKVYFEEANLTYFFYTEEITVISFDINLENFSRKSGNYFIGDEIGVQCNFTVKPNVAPSVTYQWKRNGADINGATYSYYKISDEDEGTQLSCEVYIFDDKQFLKESEKTPEILCLIVLQINNTERITGNNYLMDTLDAEYSLRETPLVTPFISFQWKRNGQNIIGATQKSYKITLEDVGQEISVMVLITGSESAYRSAALNEFPSIGMLAEYLPRIIKNGVHIGGKIRLNILNNNFKSEYKYTVSNSTTILDVSAQVNLTDEANIKYTKNGDYVTITVYEQDGNRKIEEFTLKLE